MGMNLECMLYLQKQGYLTQTKNKLLDIGPQNIYHATKNQLHHFCQNQGITQFDEALVTELKRIEYFSTPRPEERTSLLSELTDLTNIEYNSFDVCPALKTEILDLNFDDLPKQHSEYFDVILNFGTTEHIFNQWNSFKIIHDAAKVDGIIYHQLPGTGYLDHGYYCYTPVFFHDLAQANQYEILDLFFTEAGSNDFDRLGMDFRHIEQLSTKQSANLKGGRIPCFNINVILKKIVNTPFRCVLELATTHSAVNSEIAQRYLTSADLNAMIEKLTNQLNQVMTERNEMIKERNQMKNDLDGVLQSKSWRITKPLRYAMRSIRS